MQKTGVTQIGLRWIGDRAQIRTWAPLATTVSCLLYDSNTVIPLEKEEYGYWYAQSRLPKPGDRYKLIIDGMPYPDPASLYQPEGVHGPSAMIALDYAWTDQGYTAPKQHELVIYELHVGTFSESHDFSGVIERIPYLKELGINAIELMPIAQFPGDRNWGYDAVYPFAAQHSYGGAKGLQKLVDACHHAGIAVILDVVYNHFGPEGNYLPFYGPYLTDKYHTPWGDAVNYDDQLNHGIRDFVLANIRMWFEDFHIDGLRMDAVHAIRDLGPVHILQDIRRTTDEVVSKTGKQRYLFVECDLNDRRFLDPLDKNGFAMDAQWIDEFHHALRVTVGEERVDYYQEFEGIVHLAKAYENAYVFDGCYSSHRQKFFGTDTKGIAGHRFIAFSQNHDQIGNRMLGERSSSLYGLPIARLMALAVFLSPYVPLLFMGEEWGTKKPFQYFVNHSDAELVNKVREGRAREFKAFQTDADVPDPQDPATFRRSLLDWDELKIEAHWRHLAFYRELIALRKNHRIWKTVRRDNITVDCRPNQHTLIIRIGNSAGMLLAILNFSADTQHIPIENSKDQRWQLICSSMDANGDIGAYDRGRSTVEWEIPAYTGLVYEMVC